MTDEIPRVGARLRCATCGTEVVVVKVPTSAVSCCGESLTARASG